MSMSIAGKTAIVTGAAHGVGLAIAQHFVAAGANVVFADRNEEALEREAGKLAEEQGAVRVFAGDLRQKLTIKNLLSATVDAFDQVDILVNASRQVMTTDPLDPEDTSVEQLLEQNMMTALRLSIATARRMIKLADESSDRPLGSIINLSSITASRTQSDLLGLSISAAAADQMTRSLAVALAPKRIRVNGVAFGSVLSASLKDALKEDDEARSSIIDHTPMGRIAGPGEVADAAQYLASDASGFVTGHIMTVDGGRSLVDAAGTSAH